MNISIILPNYNGLTLLTQNLPRVYKALDALSCGRKELIISDDNSSDSSLEFLRKFESDHEKGEIEIIIVENKLNKGFSSNVMSGASKATGDILILLNTDVIPQSHSFASLLSHFNDDHVFAVGCMDRSVEKGGDVLRGRGIGRWERGFLMHERGENDKTETLWVSGGSGAFRKSIWSKLGGLDEMFNPFYWEDIDLSYRARKAGYKVLFDPESIVTHEHDKGAIKRKYTSDQVRTIAFRNQLLFVWKNITDYSLLLQHIVWLPLHLVKALFRWDMVFLNGFMKAVALLPVVIRRRNAVKKLFVISDREVIQAVAS